MGDREEVAFRLLRTIAGANERRGVVLALLMRLKQICNHSSR